MKRNNFLHINENKTQTMLKLADMFYFSNKIGYFWCQYFKVPLKTHFQFRTDLKD